MSLMIGVAIGVAIGWSFPQPKWVAAVWAKFKQDVIGMN